MRKLRRPAGKVRALDVPAGFARLIEKKSRAAADIQQPAALFKRRNFGQDKPCLGAPACFFRTVGFVRFQIDPARWPKTAGWMARTLATAPFRKLAKIEDAILRVPPVEQRAALIALGAPVSRETYAAASPRRGVMPI